MRPELPIWISYMQALAVPFIAALGVWIALQQMRVARSKLRHDLWDKRFGVYEATVQLIEVASQRRLSQEFLDQHFQKITGSMFLFDNDAVLSIWGVYGHAKMALGMGLTPYSDKPPEEQQCRRDEQIEAAYVFLASYERELANVFRPFLKLDRLI